MMCYKFWIRWVSILTICTGYYLVLFYLDFIFSLNYSETISQGGDLYPSQCQWLVETLRQNHESAALASYAGFAICIPFILLIFRKVR